MIIFIVPMLLMGLGYFLFYSYAQNDFYSALFVIFLINVTWILGIFGVGTFAKNKIHAYPLKKFIFFTALFLHFSVLFILPVWEDDHFRYLWDGYMVAQGLNPYVIPPESFFSAVFLLEEMESILDFVSYPERVTVYGPLAEWLFMVCFFLSPGELWPLKMIIFVADMAILALFYRLLNVTKLYIFAFCPLLIHAFLINIHIDLVAALFLLMAMLEVLRNKNRVGLLVLMTALAVAIKPYYLIFTPWLFRLVWRNYLLVLILYALLALPFWLSGGSSLVNSYFAAKIWAFNNPFFYSLQVGLGADNARMILAGVFMVGVLGVGFSVKHPVKASIRTFGLFLLCSPVVNPWYLAAIWVLAPLLRTEVWPWFAAVALWLSYASGLNTQQEGVGLYEIPQGILAAEWVLLLMGVLTQYVRSRGAGGRGWEGLDGCTTLNNDKIGPNKDSSHAAIE